MNIVDTYSNGTSWYRIYSDGWCEQGGKLLSSQNNNTVTTFLKPFKDTNYNAQVTSCNNTLACGFEARTPSSARIVISGGGTERDWVARGYIL